jgi:hypothetical protein
MRTLHTSVVYVTKVRQNRFLGRTGSCRKELSTGLPPSAGRRRSRRQRWYLGGGFRNLCGFRLCGRSEGAAGSGRTKTRSLGGTKTVLWPVGGGASGSR